MHDLSDIDQAAASAEVSAESLAAHQVDADQDATAAAAEEAQEASPYPPALEHMATGAEVRKLTNLLVYLGYAKAPSTLGGETLDGDVLGDVDAARIALGVKPPDPPEQVAESDWKALYAAAEAKKAGAEPPPLAEPPAESGGSAEAPTG